MRFYYPAKVVYIEDQVGKGFSKSRKEVKCQIVTFNSQTSDSHQLGVFLYFFLLHNIPYNNNILRIIYPIITFPLTKQLNIYEIILLTAVLANSEANSFWLIVSAIFLGLGSCHSHFLAV